MKKIISLLLALVMILSLAACGAKEEAPAAEKVEVTMIAAEYGGETAAWWADFVAKFNAANEGINLVVDVVSWNDIYTVVNTRVANGEAPDLLNIDVFADFQADGLLLPAEDWCSEETYVKFFPSLYYRVVVFTAPLQGHMLHCKGCCGSVYSLLPRDGSRKAPTTALFSIVNQLDTARRFMWNKVTRVRSPVEPASK